MPDAGWEAHCGRNKMKAERIDHIHVYVRDLEKAEQFFEDILGTKFSGPLANDVLNSRAVFEPLGLVSCL